MRNLATESMPIRASNLPNIFACPNSFLHKTMTDGMEPGGDAAQTGSIVHAGIAEWEANGKSLAAIQLMNKVHKKDYPQGDIAEAIRLYQKYVERSKSDQKGKTKFVEKKLKFLYPCSKIDETKEPLVIMGTVDLVKELTDSYNIVDHKSGRMYGDQMVMSYSPQIAAYVYGAWENLLNKTKRPIKGYITRLQDLVRRDLPFYWDTHIDLDRAVHILDSVAHRIALLRMGIIDSTPGKYCDWCGMAEYATKDSCIEGNKRVALQIAKPTAPAKMLGSLTDLLKR